MHIRVIPRHHVTGRRDACCTDGAPRVFLEGDGGLVASNRPVGGWGAGRVTYFFTQTLACMHECIRCPETPSGTLEERKLGVSRVYIAHDHLGRAERRLESAILICALLQLFSWVSGRLNALLHACQSLVKNWVTRPAPQPLGDLRPPIRHQPSKKTLGAPSVQHASRLPVTCCRGITRIYISFAGGVHYWEHPARFRVLSDRRRRRRSDRPSWP